MSFVLLFAATLFTYAVRPDVLQAIHWWPMAFLTPVVVLPFLTFRVRTIFRPFLIALVVWCVSLHLMREPSASLLLPPGPKAPGGLRIVSLNCAAGSVQAAEEAFGQTADLVLLQEVGTRREFFEAGAKAGYPFVSWSADDAVFSKTKLDEPANAIDFAAATVELNGQRVRIAALRLMPPVFRLDLWNLDCWREYSADVERRRQRMRTLLSDAALQGPTIFGGDFNATNPRIVTDNGDFAEAGRSAARGWRGTGTNDFPFAAVDQIWGSPEIRWHQAYVKKTVNSDHRMVVADFTLATL